MKLDWEVITVEPASPFRISRETQTEVSVVWVRIGLDGSEGWGEADPAAYYGESAETVGRAIEAMRPVIESAGVPEVMQRIEADLRAAVPGNHSAHAAVTSALYDLTGKRAGMPTWQALGLDSEASPVSSFTIGLGPPDEMARKAEAAADYPVLKIKVGTPDDAEILAAIREAVPGKTLRVDANAGWEAGEAETRIRQLADFGVEFVEQPLPPDDVEGYRYLRDRSALPIIHDESCLVAADIPGLTELGHGINIKLAKCGGIGEGLRMIHTARACGLSVMMGCMLETTLGIAAAAQLAPLLDYADLDGAALLRADPFSGPGLQAGRIVLNSSPGLGVKLA
ncbi:MAG: dipeptide epimerase [Gemmatimonadota bacterium]